MLTMYISNHFLGASVFLDRKLCSAPSTQTLSTSWPLLASFAWWRCWATPFVHLPYWPARSGEKFDFRILTKVVWIYFVVGEDVGYCKIWAIWRQAASFMSWLVPLLLMNKAKSPFWLSIPHEYLYKPYNMTWLLVSVSCNLTGILWDKHQQPSFTLYDVLFMSANHAISAAVHHNLSILTNNHQHTLILDVAGRSETPATCGHTQQDWSSV